MGGMYLGSQVGGVSDTLEAAQRLAQAHAGPEALLRTDDGKFIVRELKTDAASEQQIQADIAAHGSYTNSALDPNVVAFSMAKPAAEGSGERTVAVNRLGADSRFDARAALRGIDTLQGPALAAHLATVLDSATALVTAAKKDGYVSQADHAAVAAFAGTINDQLMSTMVAGPKGDTLDAFAKDLGDRVKDVMRLDLAEGHDAVRQAPDSLDRAIPGSQLDGDRYADPEAMLTELTQLDRLDTATKSDPHRCGIHAAVLAPAIAQGPAALSRVVERLTAGGKNPQLAGISVKDGVTHREIALIGEALYKKAGGTTHGLNLNQLAAVAKQMGVSAKPAVESVPYDQLSARFDKLGTGDSMVLAIDSQTAAGDGGMSVTSGKSGQPNHAVNVVKQGSYLMLVDSFHPESTKRFTTADSLVAYLHRTDTGRQLPASKTSLAVVSLPKPLP